MSDPSDPTDPRRVELELELYASVDLVWKALTDADELARWFPLQARVRPEPGGEVWLSWGEGLEGRSHIEIYEPGAHLRTVQSAERPWAAAEDAPRDEGPQQIAIDYHLQGRGGRTVLRVVHSGFGRGADWDDELDSVSNGWKFELRSLRHYLTHHRGRDRRVAVLRRRTSGSARAALDRLLGRDGLARDGGLRGLAEGQRYEAIDFAGHRRRGRIVVPAGSSQLAITVEDEDEALLRVMCERLGGQLEAWLWLSDWSGDAARVERFEQVWSARLTQLLGEATP